jgi:formate dehydrogenase iron-sulfur subunit
MKIIEAGSARAILIDTTRCTGCENCIDACKKQNHLGKDLPRRWKKRIDDLSDTRYSTFLHRPGGRSIRVQCRHCLDPACVSACLVGAMQKTKEGPVIYDSDRCMGCRYCLMACPYGVPRYEWEKPVPHVCKCTMCYDRLMEGKQPACVEACPEKALTFGSRAELLEEAHRRIAAAPSLYQNRVFGEAEIGGTSVLYVSDIPLDFLAYKPELGEKPLPRLTLAALSKVPPLFLGMGAVMTGVYWIIGRRMKLAAAGEEAVKDEGAEARDPAEGKEGKRA